MAQPSPASAKGHPISPMLAAATQPTAAAKPGAQQVTLRLAHSNIADSPRGRAADFFAKRVDELSKGEIRVQVFPNSVLGTEGQNLEAVQLGTLDLAINTVFANAIKAGSVFDLPFLFQGHAHWRKVLDSKPGQIVAETAPPLGLRILGYWAAGRRDTLATKPINSTADFKGLKIRVMQTPALIEVFKLVGANPTPMAWPEVYLGMQQKTVDAGESSFDALWQIKAFEVAKYAVVTSHSYSTTPLLMSEKRWQSLPQSAQQVLVTAEKETRDFQFKDFLKDETDVVGRLKDKGVIFTNIDLTKWAADSRSQVYPKLVTDQTQKTVLEEVLKVK
jgi:tripartite ATP-independent transporter DctP family solute receptor